MKSLLLSLLLVAAGARAQDVVDAGSPVFPADPAPAVVAHTDDVKLDDAKVDDGKDDDKDDDGPLEEMPEDRGGPVDPNAPAGPVYTADLSDEELARRWRQDPASLGPLSVGFCDSGRLINAERFPPGEHWNVVDPVGAYATKETIDNVIRAVEEVNAEFPNSPRLRINHISGRDGGYLRPHQSHQSGRDVDLAFYYPTDDPIRSRDRDKVIDVPRNWALMRSLITGSDVQLVLVDRKIQKVLYDHALKYGEDKAWLDSLFRSGKNAIFQHARRHRDHFHVRFFCPRAQELGRRIQPLLSERPEHNVVTHRVRSGDTLGHIAVRYGATIAGLRKANHLKNSFIRAGRTLVVPIHGKCTQCPIPPVLVLPARRVPPPKQASAPVEPPPAAVTN